MTPNLRSFSDELTKLAFVFGASPDESADWAEVPYDKRLELHKAYLAAKAGEDPTGYGKAMGVGGAIGGGLGGLLGGMAGKSLGGGALGALGGITVGGLLGALAARADKQTISSAKDALSSGGEEGHLLEEISDRRSAARQQAAMDQAKLNSVIRHQNDYDYGHGKGLSKRKR